MGVLAAGDTHHDSVARFDQIEVRDRFAHQSPESLAQLVELQPVPSPIPTGAVPHCAHFQLQCLPVAALLPALCHDQVDELPHPLRHGG